MGQNLGGLCTSINTKNCVFDIGGGHVIVSHNPETMKYLLGFLNGNYVERKRKAVIFFDGHEVGFPIENNLSDLPKHYIIDILDSFVKKPEEYSNFKEYCSYLVGDELANKHMIPYNEKLLKYDLEHITTDWIHKVPSSDFRTLCASALGMKPEGWKYTSTFYYPKYGGIESIIKGMKVNNVLFDQRVISIEKNDGYWKVGTSKEDTFYYEHLISTIPLDQLIFVLKDVPREVKACAKRLKATAMYVCFIKINKSFFDKKNDYTWCYFPEKKYPFHKVVFNHNLGAKTNPCLTVEGTKGCNVNEIVSHLKDIFGYKNLEIIGTNILTSGYVIHDSNYKNAVSVILNYLKEIDLHVCGRFGEWKYRNMDESVESAFDVINKIKRGMNGDKCSSDY